MNKKKKCIIICIIAAIIIIPTYVFYVMFEGSIISKMIHTYKAKNYIATNYESRDDLSVEFATYDFKMGSYYCNVQSSESEDTRFTVYKDNSSGKLTDDYSLRVDGKENTIYRFSKVMDQACSDIFIPAFPHKTHLFMWDFCDSSKIDRSKIKLDTYADIYHLPGETRLTVWVETENDEPTWDEAKVLFEDLVKMTEEIGVNVQYFSLEVEYPYAEIDGELRPTDYSSLVGASDVPKDVILSDSFEAYLENERIAREKEQQEIDNGTYEK